MLWWELETGLYAYLKEWVQLYKHNLHFYDTWAHNCYPPPPAWGNNPCYNAKLPASQCRKVACCPAPDQISWKCKKKQNIYFIYTHLLRRLLHRLTRGTSVIFRLFTSSCLLWFRDRRLRGNRGLANCHTVNRTWQLGGNHSTIHRGK